MPYAMASMGGLIGSSQNVLDGRLQISGSRLNTVSTSRIALSRPAGLSVRAEQGSFDTETSRRAVLSHVAAGLAGTFANAAFAEARSIKGGPPPPPSGGLRPLKNAIDWRSLSPNVWGDKAAAIVSTGYDFGGGRSQYHLRQMGVRLDIHFINKPEFFLNVLDPPPKFDDKGNLIDEETKKRLKEILLAL